MRIPGIYLLPQHLHLLLQALHLNLIYRMLALYLHILYGLYILKHCTLKHLLLQLRHLIGLAIFMYLFNYFSSIHILDFFQGYLQLFAEIAVTPLGILLFDDF